IVGRRADYLVDGAVSDSRDSMSAVAVQRYYFVHSSRYLAFAFAKYSGAEFSVLVMKNASDNIEDRLYYEKFSKDYSGTTILYTDLGKPDFKEKNVTFKIGWTLNWGPRDEMIRFIIRNVYLTDFTD